MSLHSCKGLVHAGAHPMQVGKWLDNQGIDAKPCVRASAAPALPAVPTQKAVEKLLAAVYAPWNDIDNGKHKPVKVCTTPSQPLVSQPVFRTSCRTYTFSVPIHCCCRSASSCCLSARPASTPILQRAPYRGSDLSLFLEACSHDLQDTAMPGHCSVVCICEPAKSPSGVGWGRPRGGANHNGAVSCCCCHARSLLVVQVRWAGDRCTVCDSDVDYDMDQLVSCDMCGITVHQSCYGVAEVPGEDDMWLCRACELKVTSLLGLCHCPKDQMLARWKCQQHT